MDISEFRKEGYTWIWQHKVATPLGEFELELTDYSAMPSASAGPSTPDAKMLKRARDLVKALVRDQEQLSQLVYEHYQEHAREHPQWMADCKVPVDLPLSALPAYIYGLVAYVATDQGAEFEGFLVHPDWEPEHKIALHYDRGILALQSE